MTEKRLVPMVAAVLAVLLLAGCGISTESNVDSTTPEGLQTFGVAVNPSAEPSKAQEVTPAVSGNGEDTNGQPGQTDEGENGGHLADDPLGTHHPAHQNAGEQADEGHQEAVADVVHHVQQLGLAAGGQRQFKVQRIVSQADQHRRYQGVYHRLTRADTVLTGRNGPIQRQVP